MECQDPNLDKWKREGENGIAGEIKSEPKEEKEIGVYSNSSCGKCYGRGVVGMVKIPRSWKVEPLFCKCLKRIPVGLPVPRGYNLHTIYKESKNDESDGENNAIGSDCSSS